MKAIETKWKGWRFRSRTEARWAVFFETAGIEFEYEPEGYVLPSGLYLPDFKIRTYASESLPDDPVAERLANIVERITFIEVKGEMPTAAEITKCGELVDYLRMTHPRLPEVFIAVGSPDIVRRVFPVFGSLNSEGRHFGEPCIFPREPGAFATAGPTGSIGLNMAASGPGGIPWLLCPLGYRTREEAAAPFSYTVPVVPPWMQRAYDAARSARFEFGQTDKRWGSE